jgi:large subunit ribosomal protein L29
MKSSEMRTLSVPELSTRVTAWQEELFRARCTQSIGQLTNPNVIRDLRRTIARAKTLINEQNRNEQNRNEQNRNEKGSHAAE